jgi:transposase
MQSNDISIELGLPELLVEGQRREGRAYIVTVRYRSPSRQCPCCGQETSAVHQYHWQMKQHRALWGQPVWLELRRRRFRCGHCGQVFTEPDEVCGWRRRSTRALRVELAQSCLAGSVKVVAKGAEVSEATVRRAFQEWVRLQPSVPGRTPPVLALDECSLGARSGCLTILYAPQERRVLQLCQGRSQASAEQLLNQLLAGETVQAVVMDMAEPFRQAVKVCCPRALIVADKFHVLTHVLRALQRVCQQVQPEASRDDALLLRQRALFTAPPLALTVTQRQQRDRLLATYPRFKAAWQVTQSFRRIYAASSRAEAALALERWWQDVCQHGPEPFLGLRHLLTHWRDELLNYFVYPVTNGFAEGKNNRIKAIIRAGYGYRNIGNLAPRIYLTNRDQLAA